MKHGVDSSIPPVGATQSDSATSSEKLLMKRIEELEEEKKILEQRFEHLNRNNSNNNNINNNNNKQVYVSEPQRDCWSPLGGQGLELISQQSPFKVTVKKALETSDDNPFKAPSTPLKKGLEISEESPFKRGVNCGPSGFVVGQPQLTSHHSSEELEKKLGLALKQIDELKKENHLLVSSIKPDSTGENDLKERPSLKTDDETKSVTSSFGIELQEMKEQLSACQAQSQIYERKAEDFEQKVKNLKSELDCQCQNAESSKIRLEEKLKEKQQEHIEDTTRFQAELSTLEEQIRDLKTKLKQQDTLFLSKENAMEGAMDKLKAQLLAAENEKVLCQSQCGKLESSLAQLERSEEEAKKLCSQLRQERDMVKAQAENLKIKFNDSECRHSRLQSQLESSEARVASLKSSADEALATHKAALNKEQETHKSEMDSIIKEKEKALKAKDGSLLTLKKEIEGVKESLQESLRKRDEAEQRCAKVEEDCQMRLSGVHSLEQRMNELEKSVAEKEKVISEGKTLMFEKVDAAEKKAHQKVCVLEERLQEQLSSIASKDGEIEACNEKLQKATDTISSLVSTLNGAKEKLDAYEAKLRSHSSLIKSAEENVSALQRRLTDAETLLCSSRKDFKESLQSKENEIAALQKENRDLVNIKENLTWQVNDLDSKLKSNCNDLKVLNESLSNALVTHTELRNEASALQVKVDGTESLKIKAEALAEDVNFYIKANECKDNQILELNNFIKSLNKDKAEVDATVERLITERETEGDRHREEVGHYTKRISDLETSSQEVLNNFLESHKSIETMQQCNDILTQSLSQSNNEIAELKSSNESLNEKVETLLKEKESIEGNNAKISNDLLNVERMYNFEKSKLSELQKTFFEDAKEKEERIKMMSADLGRKDEDLKRIEEKVIYLEGMKAELQTRVDKYELQMYNLREESNGECEIGVASGSECDKTKRDQKDKEMEELTLELISKNDELDSKVQILQAQNSSLIKVKESNEDKLQSYLSENIFLEKEVKELKREKANLQSRIIEIKMMCKELEGEKEIAISANKKLIVENSDSQKKVNMMEAEKESLQERLNIFEAEKEGLQERENAFEAEKEGLQERVHMIKAEKEGLQERVNIIEAEKESLQERVNIIEAEKEGLQEKVNVIEAEKECLQEKVKGFEVEKESLQEKVKMLEAGKELKEFLKDEECEVILESLKAFYCNSHSEDNDEGFALWLKESLCKTEEKLEEMKEFEKVNSQMLGEIESLKAKLKDLQRDYDTKIIEIENVKEDKIVKLKEEINDLLGAQNEYEALKTSLETDCDILKSKLDEFDTKLLNSESEKKDLLNKCNSLVIMNEGYEQKWNHLQNTINSLMSEIASLKEISEKKTKEIERLQNEKETLISEKVDCKRSEEDVDNLKAQLNTCMQRYDDMQNRAGELIENESVLREKLEQAENLRLSLEAQIDRLNNDVCDVKLENEALRKEKEFVIDENVSLNVLKTELLNKNKEFENEMRKEKEKTAALRQQCKEFNNTKRTLEDVINSNRTFENLLKEKEAKILEMEEKSQHLEENFKALQKQLETVTDELTESKKAVEVLLSEKENLLLDKSSLCQELAASQNALEEELEKKKNVGSELLSKCGEYELDLKEKENELTHAREELRQIQEQLETQKQNHSIQVNEMQQKMQEFSQDKTKIQNILSEKERKLNEFCVNIAEYKENVARLEARFELSQKNAHRKEKEFDKLREHQRKLKSKLKESEVALGKQMSAFTKSELKQRDLQELFDAKSRQCDQLDHLYNQVSAEKEELLKSINNLREKANQLEVQKRKLEKDLSKVSSRGKPFFSGESTSQSDSSPSIVELSQTSLMSISKAVTRKTVPISGGTAKRRERSSSRRSNVSREERKEAAYDKFLSIVSSSKEEALKKEGSSRRWTRSSLYGSQDSVKRSLTTSDSSAEENRPKKSKLGPNHEGLPSKVCKGLNDIPMGQDSPGVLTRPTTPLKIKGKAEKEDNRSPLKSLNVNNDAGRVPSSPKEEEEDHNEVTDSSADDAHPHLEAPIQRDLICHRRSSLYPRKGTRKNLKECNPQ